MKIKLPSKTLYNVAVYSNYVKNIESKNSSVENCTIEITKEYVYLNIQRSQKEYVLRDKFSEDFKKEITEKLGDTDSIRLSTNEAKMFIELLKWNLEKDKDFIIEYDKSQAEMIINGIHFVNGNKSNRHLDVSLREVQITRTLLTMSKEDIEENFNIENDITVNNKFINNVFGNTSFFIKDNEMSKLALSPSVISRDKIHGKVNPTEIKQVCNHTIGHFYLNEPESKLMKDLCVDTIKLQLERAYAIDTSELTDSTNCRNVEVNAITGDKGQTHFKFYVKTRCSDLSSLIDEKFNNKIETTIQISNKEIKNIIEMIHKFEVFETNFAIFSIEKNDVSISVPNVDGEIIKFNIEHNIEKPIKIGMSIQVLYKILRFYDDETIFIFQIAKSKENEKGDIVIKNNKDDKEFCTHNYITSQS